MAGIFFNEILIGNLSNIGQDVDLWYSANIKLSDYGKSLEHFFSILLNEESRDSDIDLLDPALLYDESWHIVDPEKGDIQIEIPAIYFKENIAMWRQR
jgi:hypothetical protein